ncbi:hypothetical protein [Nocardiopsis metallicus]|uniref:Uncharacterized protein n=1 Tax=Nocardiopsis metallicus TaxID=179819 RepID=A0A840WDU8_9ACTN|nr:hypothetical protein [Nocardiopsis metallicus]MBB5493593.1 hypothetical protein [Nocardiopsis metallicus]
MPGKSSKGKCQETASDLEKGPTPETLRKLAEGGYIGDIGYYVTEDIDYLVIDGDAGSEAADYIAEAVLNGEDFHLDQLEGNEGVLAIVATMVSRAQKAQEGGERT